MRYKLVVKNVIALIKLIGTTDVSKIGGGTVTGAIAAQNDALATLNDALATLNTDLDNKQATITGAASTIASSNLTKSRALVSSADGKVAVSAVTATELGYLSGLKSNAQEQIDALGNRRNLDIYIESVPISVGGTAYKDYTVTFDKTFISAPAVMFNFGTAITSIAPIQGVSLTLADRTTTTATVRVINNNSGTVSFNVLVTAIGIKQSS